ncbi:MAG: HlyD family efflux transporter periplasmic adaptor subunit [Terracidiphilus sp.]|jgi:putative peptide zinc metalloprotease protein
MNLSEALDAALPEIPKTRLSRTRPPCLDPDLVVREDVLDGETYIVVLQRNGGSIFRFTPLQWRVALLFDGVRTYDEIAEDYTAETGQPLSPDDVRGFAENMERDDFWYKTPQEKNLAMNQKLAAQRERKAGRKSKINIAHITFSAWDPDRYFDWLDNAIGKAVYSPWSVLAVVLLFAFETVVFITKWNIMGPDIALYYNFSKKTLLDVLQFYTLFLLLGFLHETAHGLTCKHYGGQVHAMGLMFLYLMPAFYVDVSEVWVSATKVQRLATIIAGIWIEMTVCGLAMIVWANTLTGEWLHDFAYQVILITGIAVVLINLNPLIKLDGYYFLTEFIGIPDLKERSTAFLSGWFQKHVLRLPVETLVVPRRRAPLFILYAFASGLYSYLLLFVVIRLAYNIGSKWLAEFALVPAGWLAFMIFRSRLRALRNVLKRLWERNFGPGREGRPLRVAVAVTLVVVLFVPILRDRENAYYTIEPMRSESLHAAVPGRVNAVLVQEGETVHAGQPLLRMSSLMTAHMGSSATAQAGNARFEAISSELRGDSIAGAAAEQTASVRSSGLAREAQSALVITAPTDGTVVTRDPGALVGQEVGSGQPLLDVADAGPRMVRVYIPVSTLDRIPPGAEVALALPGRFSVVRMKLAAPAGDALSLPPGLVPSQDYKGIKMPVFYCSRMMVPASAGNPRFGISGEAKIFGERRSIAGHFATSVYNLVKAHLW